MNPGEVVVAIVFLGVLGSIINNAFKAFGENKKSRALKAAEREAQEMHGQIAALEDRIRVLERIVTETSPRDDLRRQFRDLER